jgi:hypothetical protein
LPRAQQAAFVSALETEVSGLLEPSGREREGGISGGGGEMPQAMRRESDISARFVSTVDRRISGWLHVLTFAEGDQMRVVIILDEYQSRR